MDMHSELVARSLTAQRDRELARVTELRRRAEERTPVRRLTLSQRAVALFLLTPVHVPRILVRRAQGSSSVARHRHA
jgi:hypothetical protein